MKKSIVGLFIILPVLIQNGSPLCGPFPHTDMYCGKYISNDTVVFTDPDVHNYTELNQLLQSYDNRMIFGTRITSGPNGSCRVQLNYMTCQYIYPRCDAATQALIPVCRESCMEYTELCAYGINAIRLLASFDTNPLVASLVINCTHQFNAFSSATISQSCYDFYVAPTFLDGTRLTEDGMIRIVTFTNSSTYDPFCLDPEYRDLDVAITCRATGIPKPEIRILKEFVYRRISEERGGTLSGFSDEITLAVDRFNLYDALLLRCIITNTVTTLEKTIHLAYSCCDNAVDNLDVRGNNFLTEKDCYNCSCVKGALLSCDPVSQCDDVDISDAPSEAVGSSDGLSTGAIVGITVAPVLLGLVLLSCLLFLIMRQIRGTRGDAQMETMQYTVEMKSNTFYGKEKDENAAQNVTGLYNSLFVATDGRSSESQYQDMLTNLTDVKISLDELDIQQELGEGEFGTVYKAILDNDGGIGAVEVAVKTIKSEILDTDDILNFLSECNLMKKMDHPNVLGLLGICLDTPDSLPYVVIPFMTNGDLRSYLQTTRPDNVVITDYPEGLDCNGLLKMCHEIASGMEYLAEHHFIHRDLAARNCLVTSDMTIKISDFGLARQVYSKTYYKLTHKARVPIKWMALESLHDGVFNEKSDVWAFGVTCWEVFTIGGTPYPALEFIDLLLFLEQGSRLNKPKLCPSKFYDVIAWCWQLDPNKRPSFSVIVEELAHLLTNTGYINLDDLSSAQQ